MRRVHGHGRGGSVGQMFLEHGLDDLRSWLGFLLVVEGVVDGGVEEDSLPPERMDHFEHLDVVVQADHELANRLGLLRHIVLVLLASESAVPAPLLEEGGVAEHTQGHVCELQVVEAGDKPLIADCEADLYEERFYQ